MTRVSRGLQALALLGGLCGPGGPAVAQMSSPESNFSQSQRAEIVAILREALKTDPSILRDAVNALRADHGRQQEVASRAAINDSEARLTRTAEDPVAGNPVGDVTIVEFYDVRCPYCRRMLPVMSQLLAQDGRVRLVLKDLPILGPGSVLGSRALLAAQRQGGYLKLQEAIMRGPADVTEDTLQAQAKGAGLDWAKLQQDMTDPAIQSRLDGNIALAKSVGIDGTPALIIGTRMIPGAVDLPELQAALQQARR